MSGFSLIVDRHKDYRIVIRCNKATYTHWKVMQADSLKDGEEFLNTLMDTYRTNTPGPGTALPMPGPTFGQMLRGNP